MTEGRMTEIRKITSDLKATGVTTAIPDELLQYIGELKDELAIWVRNADEAESELEYAETQLHRTYHNINTVKATIRKFLASEDL